MTEERRSSGGVELFLDNRQVFLLFFACTVILSLVFGLGVVVGRRAERRAAPQPVTDPLAMLDQMGSQESGDESLTFHESLTGEKTNAPRPTLPSAKQPSAKQPSVELPPAALPAALPTAQPKAAPEKKAAAPKPAPLAAGTDEKPADAREGTYSLQLSSFQDRAEAEAFMQKLRTGGMKPYLVPTTIEGRGVWFRVRLGSFRSWEAAVAAKEKFERTQKLIAYVAKN